MAWGSPPDRRPEGDNLPEQFLGQLGGEEIFQEPLGIGSHNFSILVEPPRSRFDRAVQNQAAPRS